MIGNISIHISDKDLHPHFINFYKSIEMTHNPNRK